MAFQRFIVCGDSYSEGMTDEVIDGKYRGWADRVADVMTTAHPDFTYVNLAVRGKLIGQVVEGQVPVALKLVTGKETLVSFHAGANDALRPGYQASIAIPLYQDAVRLIAKSGARGSEIWEKRFSEFNQGVRAVGAEVGAIVVDANQEKFFSDRRFLAFDRLHLNAEGHKRCADAVLERIGLPFDPSWRTPLPPAKKTPLIIEKAITVVWFVTFAIPWILRRIQGKSSGDGRSAKYPTPVKWPLR